jgi:hypothetical protein
MGFWPPEWYYKGGTHSTRNVASLEASEDRTLLASQTHPDPLRPLVSKRDAQRHSRKLIIGIITDERKIYSDFVRNYLQRLGR